jgi:hypothetical protein
MSCDETAVVNSQFILVDYNSNINPKNRSVLTACRKVLFEKLIVTQVVKNFPSFDETLRFIILFSLACHGTLS